jgi:hypothetical protein
MKKLAFIMFFFTAAVLFTQLPLAHAGATTTLSEMSPSVNVPACGITSSDLSIIQTIQNDPTLDYSSELQQELAARRQLLTKIILCAKTDALQQQTDLMSATVDPSFQTLKNQWLSKLSDAITYYDLQLGKVNNAGVSGTEAIAKEVLLWRGSNYVPLAENVSDFIIWSKNQTFFTTAESRLAQIKNLVSSPLFSENLDVQNDFGEAAASLTTAESENLSAKNAFAESLSPEESLNFIGQSLVALSSTYQHFFDVGNLIQSLLPQ